MGWFSNTLNIVAGLLVLLLIDPKNVGFDTKALEEALNLFSGWPLISSHPEKTFPDENTQLLAIA